MSMHITSKVGEIAERVILVGDPARAKHIAETMLDGAVCVNEKRAAYCYTGKYGGVDVSVMAVGMGVPSMLIYATELCRDYGVKKLIRCGTGGGYRPDMQLNDIVLAQATCTTSSLNDNMFNGTFCPIASFDLLKTAQQLAAERGLRHYVGNTVCNDRIYRDNLAYSARRWVDYGVLCSEMEGAALYTVAAEYSREALMLVAVMSYITIGDDNSENGKPLAAPSVNRFDDYLVLALETIVK